MATIPFGLSISHLVSSAGADVGFAAILGLAILVLLFFSQARETATLRRRADEAEEQLRHLAGHVDQLSRTRPAAQPVQAPATGTVVPVPPPAAARVAARQAAFSAASRPVPAGRVGASSAGAGATGAVATIPAAPAGVGAPALSSATRLIPLAPPEPISIRALKNGDAAIVPEPEATPAPASAPAATVAPAAPAGPPPSTAAGGANGSARAAMPPPAPLTDVPPPREPQRRETAAPGRPVGPLAFNDPVPPNHTRVSRLALVAASVVAVIVVIVAVLVLVNRGSSPTTAQNAASTGAAKSTSTRAGQRTRHPAAVTVTPSAVTVAVLNGTTTAHLAADVMSKLNSAGYKSGATTNAPEQNLTSTIVGYTQPSFRADALAVAKSLNLGPASVQGVSQGDRSAACPGAASCPAQVIVSLGSDLSSVASSAATASTT
jgi:LytR cell envelope-related transcriptional attenuator